MPVEFLGVNPRIHCIIMRVPELPKLLEFFVRHPRLKFLRDIELWHWNNFDVIFSLQKIAVEFDSNFANRTLCFCHMAYL